MNHSQILSFVYNYWMFQIKLASQYFDDIFIQSDFIIFFKDLPFNSLENGIVQYKQFSKITFSQIFLIVWFYNRNNAFLNITFS